MKSITDVRVTCKCGWWGIVGETIPDIDGDGSLGCPQCKGVINAYAETPPPPRAGQTLGQFLAQMNRHE